MESLNFDRTCATWGVQRNSSLVRLVRTNLQNLPPSFTTQTNPRKPGKSPISTKPEKSTILEFQGHNPMNKINNKLMAIFLSLVNLVSRLLGEVLPTTTKHLQFLARLKTVMRENPWWAASCQPMGLTKSWMFFYMQHTSLYTLLLHHTWWTFWVLQ